MEFTYLQNSNLKDANFRKCSKRLYLATYVAALSAANSPTKQDTVDLFAHMSAIFQMMRDLVINESKEKRTWGDLNSQFLAIA